MTKTKSGKGKAAALKTKHKPYERPVQGRRKRATTTTTSARGSTTTIVVAKATTVPPPPPPVPFDWKNAFILGIKLHDPARHNLLQSRNHSFLNLRQIINDHHPGMDAYVFINPESSSSSGAEVELMPVQYVILVPSGESPPSFMARPCPQQGTDTIYDMKDVNMFWKEVDSGVGGAGAAGGGGRVFTLQCSLQRTTQSSLRALGELGQYDFEYYTPFIIKPSIQAAKVPLIMFDIMLPNGEEVASLTFEGRSEERKTKCINKILEEYAEEGLNKNNVEQFNAIKAAIDEAIAKQEEEDQQKKDLLTDYSDETLDAMHCIKIYPNEFTGMHNTYVGKYYMRAIATYPVRVNNNAAAAAAAIDIWAE